MSFVVAPLFAAIVSMLADRLLDQHQSTATLEIQEVFDLNPFFALEDEKTVTVSAFGKEGKIRLRGFAVRNVGGRALRETDFSTGLTLSGSDKILGAVNQELLRELRWESTGTGALMLPPFLLNPGERFTVVVVEDAGIWDAPKPITWSVRAIDTSIAVLPSAWPPVGTIESDWLPDFLDVSIGYSGLAVWLLLLLAVSFTIVNMSVPRVLPERLRVLERFVLVAIGIAAAEALTSYWLARAKGAVAWISFVGICLELGIVSYWAWCGYRAIKDSSNTSRKR